MSDVMESALYAWPPVEAGQLEKWANEFLVEEDCRFWERSEPKGSEMVEQDPGRWEEDEDGGLYFGQNEAPPRLTIHGYVITSDLKPDAEDVYIPRRRYHAMKRDGGGDKAPEFVWEHKIMRPDGTKDDLIFDTGSVLFTPNAHAYVNLLRHGFDPSPHWLWDESFQGDEVRAIDAIRMLDGIPDGDEDALRAAIARRIIAAAPTKRPTRAIVHAGRLYLCRNDGHVILHPDGEWHGVDTMNATTPRLTPEVARTWLEMGAPRAWELLGRDQARAIRAIWFDTDQFMDLPNVAHAVLAELNCPPSPADRAKTLLRLALSGDRWPSPRTR